MPKYIQRRRERKEYRFFYGIEHKFCKGICKKLKPLDQFYNNARAWDGKCTDCKSCRNKKSKQRQNVIKEKRKKEREAAPTGFLVCLNTRCTENWLQPLDQFISDYARNDKPTSRCKFCRENGKELDKQRQAACQKIWDDWRKTHPCVKCMNDIKYEHNYLLIEADHLGIKVKACSEVSYWSHSQRGVPALRAELMTVQALCRFHHRLTTQQRDRDNGRIQKKSSILKKRTVINVEKHNRGCCLLCNRVLKKGEECAFDFDHRDPNTKFKYKGKSFSPGEFVGLPNAVFATQWPLEQAKCDLLCANCHKLKTCASRDAYKNKTNKLNSL